MSARQESSDEEHFSDATEGKDEAASPIPTTRVERVDNEQSHGEVPGTEAFDMRTQDAAPDEMEIIPEPDRKVDIPQTIVEKVDDPQPSHGEVPGTEAHELRKADAAPDIVTSAPATGLEGSPTSPRYRSSYRRRKSSRLSQSAISAARRDEPEEENEAGDDFDEFEEGNGEDDDFGAFDEGFEEKETPIPPTISQPQQQHFSLLDFRDLDNSEDILSTSQIHVQSLFANFPTKPQPQLSEALPEAAPSFLTERSQSLWAQLVAPPPLQPPNWVRSRIRRLFLVSLGVPVDLDEILPASKQKKLVLPSLDTDGGGSTSRLTASRDSTSSNNARPGASPEPALAKLRTAAPNDSSTSVNSSTSKGPMSPDGRAGSNKRRGAPRAPDFDLLGTRLLCSTTETALQNLSEAELKSHVARLKELKGRASEVLEHWLVQRDSARGDKEAFEEVIENLVKHAKKIRK